MKTKIIIASTLGFLGVALGAFGAHGLRGQLDTVTMHAYETAVQYHFYHILALIGILALDNKLQSRLSHYAFYFFVFGIIFFSGSLYSIAFAKVGGTSLSWLGPITPIGGIILMAGWATTGLAALKNNSY